MKDSKFLNIQYKSLVQLKKQDKHTNSFSNNVKNKALITPENPSPDFRDIVFSLPNGKLVKPKQRYENKKGTSEKIYLNKYV